MILKKQTKLTTSSWSSIQNIIILGSGSGKTNSLFNLISHQPDIDKIYLYAEDLYKAKYR